MSPTTSDFPEQYASTITSLLDIIVIFFVAFDFSFQTTGVLLTDQTRLYWKQVSSKTC
jgi:hypothetical protein